MARALDKLATVLLNQLQEYLELHISIDRGHKLIRREGNILHVPEWLVQQVGDVFLRRNTIFGVRLSPHQYSMLTQLWIKECLYHNILGCSCTCQHGSNRNMGIYSLNSIITIGKRLSHDQLVTLWIQWGSRKSYKN